MNKNLIAGIIIVLIAAVALFFVYKPKPLGDTNDEANSQSREKLTWTFKEVTPGDGMNPPTTKVTLVAGSGGDVYNVGTHEGTCSVIEESSWPLLAGERTGVICYFAGGGTEIGVFDEAGRIVVKTGVVEEGDAETAGTRGNFKTLLELR